MCSFANSSSKPENSVLETLKDILKDFNGGENLEENIEALAAQVNEQLANYQQIRARKLNQGEPYPISNDGFAEGYFTNTNDFFGRGRKEFLHISKEGNIYSGLKILGDSNVPRGKVSFRTLDLKEPITIKQLQKGIPAELQIRRDINDENGFEWISGITVRFKDGVWIIDRLGMTGKFSRVSRETAIEAALHNDWE